MASASGYNHHRFARAVLKKSRKWEPSLTVQLHSHFWRFAESTVHFQYEGPMKPFLLALRAQVIPSALIPFLYDIQPPVSFVDGCLVVEIQDFRKFPETKSRVVMRPAAESLAQTIDVMLDRKGEVWDEQLALELESRIIVSRPTMHTKPESPGADLQAATSPPLYLGTSILATRNAVLALNLTSPATPNLGADGSFRNPSSIKDAPTSTSERMRRLLLTSERASAATGTPFQPNWAVLRSKEALEQNQARQREREAAARQNMANAPELGVWNSAPGQGGNADASGSGGNAGSAAAEPPKKKKKKRPAATDDTIEAAKEEQPKKKKKATAAAADKDKDKDKDKEKPATAKKDTSPESKKKGGAAAASAGGATATAKGDEETEKPKPKKKKKPKAEE